MTSIRKRLLGAAAVAAFVAASTVCAATAAQADGGYYGSWTLITFKMGKKSMKCDSPPNDEGMCAAGMTLDLKADYRYKSTIKGLNLLVAPGKGDFVTATVSGTGSHVIVFNLDTYPTFLRSWEVTLKGTRYGAPQKMVLSGSLGENPEDPSDDAIVKLVFQRNAK